MSIPRVILWTAPRSVSTAFTRAVTQTGKSRLIYEPYGVVYYLGAEANVNIYGNDGDDGSSTEKSTSYDSSLKNLTYDDITRAIWNKNDDSNFDFVFMKEHAYCFTQPKDGNMYKGLLANELSYPRFQHTFLIRHPLKTTKSHMKIEIPNWELDVNKEVGSSDILAIYDECKELGFENLIVVDADDLLSDPQYYISKYCDKLGLKYSDDILTWDQTQNKDWIKNARMQDVVWFQFHESLLKSGGFGSFDKQQSKKDEESITMDYFPKHMHEALEKQIESYNTLYSNRMQ